MNIEKIDGGWLAEKWKIELENYSIMIKVIDDKKIKRGNINFELAYELLEKVNNYGVKSSKIYRINNKIINFTHQGNPIIIT